MHGDILLKTLLYQQFHNSPSNDVREFPRSKHIMITLQY